MLRATTLGIAPGNMARIMRNGQAADRKHRRDNGSLHRVQAFDKNGDIALANGWTIDTDFGHLAPR
jgi:hypothetical protein